MILTKNGEHPPADWYTTIGEVVDELTFEIVEPRADHAQIIEALARVGFLDMEIENLERWKENVGAGAANVISAWLRKHDEMINRGYGISISGTTGSGKSTVAAAMIYEMIRLDILARGYYNAEEIRRRFQVIQFVDLVESLVDNAQGPIARVLVIDNLKLISEYRRNIFENYATKRCQRGLSTWYIITTTPEANYAKYRAWYPELFSRQNLNVLIETVANDHRVKESVRMLTELTAETRKAGYQTNDED